jgi:hypothetical protein
VLRIINSWCDRFVAAARKPTRSQRQEAIDDIGRELREEKLKALDSKTLPAMALDRRRAVSWQIGVILTALMMPAEEIATTTEDRGITQFELTKLAFAMAEYRAAHGRYPAKLADLVPEHVKKLPKDLFADGAEFHYKPDGGGYLLYSIGDNGEDDRGKGRDVAKNGEGWDDLSVRMSGAKP